MSTAINYVPIGAGEFTKELLDSNFAHIASYTQYIDQRFGALEEAVSALSKHALAVDKVLSKKPSLLKWAIIGGVGYYAYRTFKGSTVEINGEKLLDKGKVNKGAVQRLKDDLAAKMPANSEASQPAETRKDEAAAPLKKDLPQQ